MPDALAPLLALPLNVNVLGVGVGVGVGDRPAVSALPPRAEHAASRPRHQIGVNY